MGITKRMAVAVSGLVFTGAAALAVGAADSASAQAPVIAPQGGCRGGFGGCRGSNRHHFRNLQSHHFRTNERVIVINRNNNFGRSDSGQHMRQQDHQQFPQQMKAN